MTSRRRFVMESLEDRTVPAALVDVSVSRPDPTADRPGTGRVHHVSVELPQNGPNALLVIGASNDPEVLFVQKLYYDLLGRGIDVGAVVYVDALDAGESSRRDVAESILHSDEYAAHRIDGMFKAFLGRHADQPSLAGHLQEVKDGKSLEDVAVDILASDEYRTLNAGKGQFVNALFEDVLGRRPEPRALSDYSARYGAAEDAEEIHGLVEEVVKSKESQQQAGELAVELMLNQKPTATLGAKFVAAARDGAAIDAVLADLAATQEYYNLDTVR